MNTLIEIMIILISCGGSFTLGWFLKAWNVVSKVETDVSDDLKAVVADANKVADEVSGKVSEVVADMKKTL